LQIDEVSAKPSTFLKFHHCVLFLSAGELAMNTHLSASVKYSRSAKQADGADDGEVPVSNTTSALPTRRRDRGQTGGYTALFSDLPGSQPRLPGLESTVCLSGSAKFKPFGDFHHASPPHRRDLG